MQLNQVGVVKPPQQLVLLQHQLPLLCLVRGDLGRKHLAGLGVPAQGYHAETTPERWMDAALSHNINHPRALCIVRPRPERVKWGLAYWAWFWYPVLSCTLLLPTEGISSSVIKIRETKHNFIELLQLVVGCLTCWSQTGSYSSCVLLVLIQWPLTPVTQSEWEECGSLYNKHKQLLHHVFKKSIITMTWNHKKTTSNRRQRFSCLQDQSP